MPANWDFHASKVRLQSEGTSRLIRTYVPPRPKESPTPSRTVLPTRPNESHWVRCAFGRIGICLRIMTGTRHDYHDQMVVLLLLLRCSVFRLPK